VREGDVFVNAGVWENLYQSLQKPQMDPVITGFNANIDRVIPVTSGMLRSFEQHTVPGFDALLDRLKHSMRYCSADEVFISEPSVYHELTDSFSTSGTLAIGGQAGITAVHMRRLGITSVTCAVPGAGPQTCNILQNAGVIPLTFESGAGDRSDTIHLIFEYTPDLVPVADGVVPRSNRFIVSPVHDSSTVIIPEAFENSFLEQIASCRRAFLSGYQYLRKEQEFITAARQIQMIRGVNPLMRTHVECVSGADRSVLATMLRHIIPNTDSIGLNEQELGLFMHVLRETDPRSAATTLPSSPVAYVREAIALADATRVPRIHLHAFGYYILILKPGTVQPELSRNALLLAARVTADTAGGDEQILSREGLLAYAAVREVFGPDQTPGIFRVGNRVVVLIPTYISQNIQKTTGLGDVLSSTAFVADPF
jgi:ADP-dependent phosphofructokinase/glucokinase